MCSTFFKESNGNKINHMKKSFIFLILILIFRCELKSQSKVEILHQLILQLSNPDLFEHRRDSSTRICQLSEELLKNIQDYFYIKNDSVTSLLDSTVVKIYWKWQGREPSCLKEENSLSMLNHIYHKYKASLKYLNLSGVELFDSLIRNWEFILLKDKMNLVDEAYLKLSFVNFNDCGNIYNFLALVDSYLESDELYFYLVYSKIDIIRNCRNIYSRFISKLQSSTLINRDYLINSELQFISDSFNNEYREHCKSILYGTYVDSFLYRSNLKIDLKLDSLKKQRIIKQAEDSKYRDSIDMVFSTDNLTAEQKLDFLILDDTTLMVDFEFPPYYLGDDGMRFDTFSNTYLINLIDNLVFSQIYDTVQNSMDLNMSSTVIHLRKIFQLLGDRNTFGSYTSSPQDTGILYAWVDKYYDAVLHSSYPAMQDEAADQIIRLWRLVYPRWVGWLKNENLMERALIKQRIIYMLNEELILDLIARGDAVYTPESPKEAHILADPLLDVFYGVVIPEHLKSARRPSWSAVDAQRWVDDYIVPALKRWKYFGF
jgi:hypothetical protein